MTRDEFTEKYYDYVSRRKVADGQQGEHIQYCRGGEDCCLQLASTKVWIWGLIEEAVEDAQKEFLEALADMDAPIKFPPKSRYTVKGRITKVTKRTP